MKSGLYALAGVSATARAAACAKRFDEPMTNRSNVYFGLRPTVASRCGCSSPVLHQRVVDDEPHRAIAPGGVAGRGADEVEEMPLDPLAREVVRNGEHEGVPLLRRLHVTEPRPVRRVVQSAPEPTGDLIPQRPGGQLARLLHAWGSDSSARRQSVRAYHRSEGRTTAGKRSPARPKTAPICRDFRGNPKRIPQVWNVSVALGDNARRPRRLRGLSREPRPARTAVDNFLWDPPRAVVYTPRPRGRQYSTALPES